MRLIRDLQKSRVQAHERSDLPSPPPANPIVAGSWQLHSELGDVTAEGFGPGKWGNIGHALLWLLFLVFSVRSGLSLCAVWSLHKPATEGWSRCQGWTRLTDFDALPSRRNTSPEATGRWAKCLRCGLVPGLPRGAYLGEWRNALDESVYLTADEAYDLGKVCLGR